MTFLMTMTRERTAAFLACPVRGASYLLRRYGFHKEVISGESSPDTAWIGLCCGSQACRRIVTARLAEEDSLLLSRALSKHRLGSLRKFYGTKWARNQH
jgi:hypothetical protein